MKVYQGKDFLGFVFSTYDKCLIWPFCTFQHNFDTVKYLLKILNYIFFNDSSCLRMVEQ